MKETILVTGGAGYIGSHAVVELIEQNYSVVVIDSLENGFLQLVDKRAKFYKGNIADSKLMNKIFSENKIDVVMHFAAYIKVIESVNNPLKYYSNNVVSTIKLLESMKENNVKKIIFSSTAAVYGEILTNEKVSESHSTNPINPYGKSKLMAEEIIKDFSQTEDMKYVIFRYFNVAGAHNKYKIGQMDNNSTALIPKLVEAVNNDEIFNIFGNDYNTADGTCVRDFIHVLDLVKAHIAAIEYLKNNHSETFNLGSENGYSILQTVEVFSEILKKTIVFKFLSRREGDPASVIASSKKANLLLKWETKYGIDDILKTSLKWQKIKIKEH